MTPTHRYDSTATSASPTPGYYDKKYSSEYASSRASAYSKFQLPAVTSPIVDNTKSVGRMRTQRQSSQEPSENVRGSNSALDRVGLSAGGNSSNGTGSSLRSRPSLSSFSSANGYVNTANSRPSILEATDVLKPVTTSPYARAGYSRTPSTNESVYDYSARTSSLARPAYSRETSLDRLKDSRASRRRRVPTADSEDDDISVASGSVKVNGASNGGLPPTAGPMPSSSSSRNLASYERLDQPRSSLQRYDSISSLRSRDGTGFPSSLSNGSLQRCDSASSLGPRYSSRRSSRGNVSVNFDLSNVESSRKRDPSPVVLMSRVAIDKELPLSKKPASDVETRYVVSKFPVDYASRDVPVSGTVRPRDASRERAAVNVAPVKGSPLSLYNRQDSRERVIGGKAFASDSSLGSSSSDEDSRYPNSIIRAASPKLLQRTISGLRKPQINVDESEKAGLIGLKNLGNTCFMNSILQCLSNTRPLRDYCLSGEYESDVNTSTSQMKGALISAFASVLEALWKRHTSYSATSPYIPDKFHRQVQQYAPRFSGYLQQDAQEFLRYLLEGLHEDVNRVTDKPKAETCEISEHLSDGQKATEAWKHYLKRDNSKIVDLYVGQLKSSLICESCNYCSVTFDPFWDLSLPIPGNRSGRSTYSAASSSTTNIYECFKLFTKEETLDGDECPTCCHCKTRQKCRKFFTIQRFPRYLVIHLKRFSQERFRAKLSTLVEYPIEKLNLSPFAAESHVGPHPKYNLYSIACHSGSTHCGHYIAYCKHPVSGKWNEYNDSRVTPINLDEIVTSEAYVLCYELAS